MTGPPPPRFFRSADVDPAALAGARVTVVGFGNLGRSVALNLRDSGLAVRVGTIDDAYRTAAADAGFEALDIASAVVGADLVYALIPDEHIPGCYAADIAPGLDPGAAVVFASGYALAFGLVKPAAGVDVLLLAPRMLGDAVRHAYLDRTGFFSYLAVEQDASGRAWERLLALAEAVGSLRRGAMELAARDEALLDLLIEQTVGPYLGVAIQLAFQAGVEAGLPPEAMVLEMYMSGEMARTFDTFARAGFYRSTTRHGLVAQYGGFLRTLEMDRAGMDGMFRAVLEDIRSGGFAARLQAEREAGYPTAAAIAALTGGDDPITAAEERVRRALEG